VTNATDIAQLIEELKQSASEGPENEKIRRKEKPVHPK
jgi:hypothetical protein